MQIYLHITEKINIDCSQLIPDIVKSDFTACMYVKAIKHTSH